MRDITLRLEYHPADLHMPELGGERCRNGTRGSAYRAAKRLQARLAYSKHWTHTVLGLGPVKELVCMSGTSLVELFRERAIARRRLLVSCEGSGDRSGRMIPAKLASTADKRPDCTKKHVY